MQDAFEIFRPQSCGKRRQHENKRGQCERSAWQPKSQWFTGAVSTQVRSRIMFYGKTILRTDAVVFRNNLVLHKFPSQTAGHRPINYSALQPSKVGSRRLSKHSFDSAKACAHYF